MSPRRRDDQSVGRVAVKRHWQLVEREYHFDAKRQHRHHSFVSCSGKPFGEGKRQLQPPLCAQDLRFPKADRRKEKFAAGRYLVKGVAFGV